MLEVWHPPCQGSAVLLLLGTPPPCHRSPDQPGLTGAMEAAPLSMASMACPNRVQASRLTPTGGCCQACPVVTGRSTLLACPTGARAVMLLRQDHARKIIRTPPDALPLSLPVCTVVVVVHGGPGRARMASV